MRGLWHFHLSALHPARRDPLPRVPGARGQGGGGSSRASIPAPELARTLKHPRRSVRVALAPLLAKPSSASIQISQLLGGHAVDVREERGEWLRVAGADGYDGWVHGGYLGGAVRTGNGSPPSGWRTRRALSLGCTARTTAGAHLRLPLGAHLPGDGVVETGEAMPLASRRASFPLAATAIIESAERFFSGTPYVWGGVTPWGADCSGFVQSVFALHGLHLPRDAWQQARAGTAVPERDAVEAGDLVFFCATGAARMSHVAVAVSADLVVHLSVSRGGFALERLPAPDAVSRSLNACYRFARRVLVN
ncbi:MAG TPA: SH3 domain-containing C40 family peptidase [Gemmatimonadaceae bacterium]|nr:SH3 domain-containing C40 family peptidase [Gemmatimonadaceae bacterium]